MKTALPLYDWPDGPAAFLEAQDETLSIRVDDDHGTTLFRLWIDDSSLDRPDGISIDLVSRQSEPDWFRRMLRKKLEPKIRGLLLDLGRPARRDPVFAPWLAVQGNDDVAGVPTFLSDEVYAAEIERLVSLFATLLGDPRDDLAGDSVLYDHVKVLPHVRLSMEIDDFRGDDDETETFVLNVFLGSHADENRTAEWAFPVEGCDEAQIRKHVRLAFPVGLVFPESSRATWMVDNVEFGRQILFDPAEKDLYEMMGMQLPIWWPADRALEWFRERVASATSP